MLSACGGSDGNMLLGGQFRGVTKTGLVLQNNGGSDLVINPTNTGSGDFAFSSLVETDDRYNVTVKPGSIPSNASECTVTNGSGRVVYDVTNIFVVCTLNQHELKGTITGLTRGSSAAHIARAALESIAYQTMDVLKAMEADSGISIKELRVDGGATKNNLLMQFQSDVLNTKVIRPTVTETTALGAAYLAGLAVGFWKNMDELQEQWQIEKVFSSTMPEQERAELTNGWKKAITAALSIA
jgi:sugar (pentulose or hexulose) kinase